MPPPPVHLHTLPLQGLERIKKIQLLNEQEDWTAKVPKKQVAGVPYFTSYFLKGFKVKLEYRVERGDARVTTSCCTREGISFPLHGLLDALRFIFSFYLDSVTLKDDAAMETSSCPALRFAAVRVDLGNILKVLDT